MSPVWKVLLTLIAATVVMAVIVAVLDGDDCEAYERGLRARAEKEGAESLETLRRDLADWDCEWWR